MNNILFLVERIGPYHDARFKQLQKKIKVNFNLKIVEFFAKDEIYEWEMIRHNNDYNKITLFKSQKNKIFLIFSLFNLIRKNNRSIVVIPGWGSIESIFSLLIAKIYRCKTIILSDSSEFDYSRYYFLELVKKFIVKNFDGAFVAGSSHKKYISKLGMPLENIFTGYDVVDNTHFNSNLNDYKHDGYFLAIGRFIQRKNFIKLLESFNLYLKKKENNAKKLVLCGSGIMDDSIRKKIKEFDLQSNVSILGFVQYEDLPKIYKGASVFIIPSTTEQWGLVVNEAMASGLPILSSEKCGCSFDLVDDGINGYIFNPFDINDIEEKLTFFDNLSINEKKQFSLNSLKIIEKWSTYSFSDNLLNLISLIKNEK